jgi:glycosyltransferase involved in cell wall biosynthesis
MPSGGRPVVAERRSARGRLLVVSHPCVVSVNQAVYRRLGEVGWDPFLVVPARWRHEYAEKDFAPIPLAGLEDRLRPVRVVLPGRPQRHLYLTRPSRLIREIRPRVAFLEQEPFSLSALQWGLALSRAGISFGVQAAENVDRPIPRPARWIRCWILRRAAFVAARSPAAGELARRWGAAGDVVTAPHAVPEWTARPRRNGRPFTVGFAGRLVPEKGIADLVEAVRRLDGPVRLLLVGDGPLREELAQAKVPGGEIEVRTGVSHERMPEVYAEMDVLTLPSRTTTRGAEQFGRVLPEALSCGVPVVGSDVGGIPWVIEATGGGRLFPEGDCDALASILSELRASPETRLALVREGQASVARLFGVAAAGATLDRALSSAADEAGAGQRERAGSGDSRPTVALVAHGIHDQGGMERAFFELVRQGHRDCRFVVIAAELAPELRPLVEWKRIRVPMRPIPLKFVLFLAVAAVRLARTQADLVHTMGAIVPNRADLACVQFCHAGFREFVRGRELEGRPPLRRLNTGIARALGHSVERWWYGSGRVRRLAAVSPGVRRELERHYPGVRVEITPNGVDPRRLRPDAEARRELRAEQGLGEEDLVVLFVGGDWDHKGLAVAIEAVERAAKAGGELRLWVVGRGDDARFGELASRHHVAGRVRFFGPRRDTERFFQAADVFVLPTLYETFSLVAYEAAASGLPIVATRVSGIDDLIGDGQAGLVVERSPEAVAAALVRLASDPAERARMGGAGRRRAEAFTWERSVSSVLDLYGSLAPAAFPAEASR